MKCAGGSDRIREKNVCKWEVQRTFFVCGLESGIDRAGRGRDGEKPKPRRVGGDFLARGIEGGGRSIAK